MFFTQHLWASHDAPLSRRFLMPYPTLSPSILLSFFQTLFAGIPGFLENKDEPIPGRVRFIRDYPEKSIRIVVTTPIKRFQSGLSSPVSFDLVPGMRIFFAIQHYNNKNHLNFRDSRVTSTDTWTEITGKKAKTLVELVDGIKLCPGSECTGLYPFPFVETAPQGKPESTRFVWCKCLKCRMKQETPYGKGLRTNISRHLPKKK